ncbi:MAG: hypothetical protein K0R26_1785 [Bacteroidota bacterium]|jgi:hypothetical protein|nr:hypothetical protein [Bacteroidota bacterium]
MKKIILLASIINFGIHTALAQVPILEKTYEVSRKAKNGYLGNIEMNKEKETIDMIYILPSLLPRKVKTEIYTYDKDLNLLNTVREEEWAEKLKTRWKWFNYKGDVYSTINLAASVDLTGGVVFRQKQITYYYNWYYGRYTKKVKQLEKIKAKTETDSKYAYKASYEVEADSNLLVLAGRTEKKTHRAFTHFDVLSCDNKINIKTTNTLEFKNPQVVVFSAPLKDDNEALSNDDFPRDWILVFAPMGTFKDDRDPNPTNYSYVRLTPQGQIVERFNFDSPSNGWRILGAYEKDGSVFLYGSAITKDPKEKYFEKVLPFQMVPTTSASQEEKDLAATAPSGVPFGGFAAMGSTDYGATQEALDVPLDELKYTNFQIGKITDGKFDFISSPNIEEFEKKKAKPADQKKYVAFDGKKFVVNGISFTSSGDVFISGQDFVKKDNKKIYKGVYMFQFEPKGNLKKNYGVFIDQSKKKGFMSNKLLTSDMIMADNSIFESSDGKSLYWLMRSAKTVVCHTETSGGYKTETCTPLFGFDYGSINIANGELSEFKSFGDDEKREYYLYANTSSYKMGHNLFFFSETKKGDKILLTRMDLTK